MEQKMCIGKIVKPVGIKGEVKILPLTDDVSRFKNLKYLFVENNLVNIEKMSIRTDFAVAKIEGVDTPQQAEMLREKLVYVDRKDAVKLKQNQYFIVDLIGCDLVKQDGTLFGKITDTENFGAGDIIVFEHENKEFRAPFVSQFFGEVDTENKKVIVLDDLMGVMV